MKRLCLPLQHIIHSRTRGGSLFFSPIKFDGECGIARLGDVNYKMQIDIKRE